MPSDRGLANFNLTLTACENDERGLDLEFEYATDLFEPVTITQLAASFRTLLADVVADDGRPIAAVRTVAGPAIAASLTDFDEGELDAHDLHNLEMALGRLFDAE